MRKIFPLIVSLFMFLLTTLTWVLLSISLKYSFDLEQKVILGMIIFAGYLSSGLYAWEYIDKVKTDTRSQGF